MKFAKKPYSPYVKAGSWRIRDRYIAMIAKLTSVTPTILTAALAVIFVVAGIINIIGRGTVKTDFARWGFPDGFNIVAVDWSLSARRCCCRFDKILGVGVAWYDHDGCDFSLLRYREPISHLAPALGIAKRQSRPSRKRHPAAKTFLTTRDPPSTKSLRDSEASGLSDLHSRPPKI